MNKPTYREWQASLPIRPAEMPWMALLSAILGQPITPEERAAYLKASGGIEPPPDGADEVCAVIGRRSNKSEQMARLAFYECIHAGHHLCLAPGQVAVFLLIGALKTHATELLNYAKGLAALKELKNYIAKITATEILFKNGIALQTCTADEASARGKTAAGAIFDECAQLPGEDTATPGSAILAAVRPCLMPLRGAPKRRLIMITSAYVTEGVAYETFIKNFGIHGAPVLCVTGTTQDFNPNIEEGWFIKRKAADPLMYSMEIDSIWSPAITEGWFNSLTIDKSIDRGRTSSPYINGIKFTVSIDAAYKSDRFTICVCYSRLGRTDDVTGKPGKRTTVVAHVESMDPKDHGGELSPAYAVARVAKVCRLYNTDRVIIDQHTSTPLKEAFKQLRIKAIVAPWKGGASDDSKSARYRSVRSAMQDGALRLPDHQELITELNRMRGKRTGGESEKIEGVGGHDDLVAAMVLGVSTVLQEKPCQLDSDLSGWELREKKRQEQAWDKVFGGTGRNPIRGF